MKEKILYCIWACMYILCVGLSFITPANTISTAALTVISLLFFVPGAMILYDARKTDNKKGILRVRVISALSLGLTAVTLIATFLCVTASKEIGELLYELLILVSAPMICSQYWFISLFLWACLFAASRRGKKQVE